jgi:hypothetical protein
MEGVRCTQPEAILIRATTCYVWLFNSKLLGVIASNNDCTDALFAGTMASTSTLRA